MPFRFGIPLNTLPSFCFGSVACQKQLRSERRFQVLLLCSSTTICASYSMITLPCICLLYHNVNPLGAMISIDPSLVRLTLLSVLSASTAQSESFVWAVIICGKMHKRLIRRNLIINVWFYSVDMRRGLL